MTSTQKYDGVAVSVVGGVNTVANSNGVFVGGYGNDVKNSYAETGMDAAVGVNQDTIMGSVLTKLKDGSAQLGQVGVIGAGNTVDNGKNVFVTGMQSTVTNATRAQVTGFKQVVTGVTDTNVVGTSNTVSNSANALVMGANNSMNNATSVFAIGDNMVVGSGSTTARNSVLIGDRIRYGDAASAQDSIAIGSDTVAVTGAVAVGVTAQATGINSIAIGYGAKATGSLATGALASAGNGGAAYGDNASATYLGGATVPGTMAGAAFGQGASAEVSGGTALGTGSSVTAVSGVALGHGSVATVAGGAAGYNPTAATAAQIAAIQATNSTTLGAVSVGTGAAGGNRQIVNVAAGTNDSDAVNVAQLKAAQAASGTHYYSVNDGGTQKANYDNDGATGLDSLAAGVRASAKTGGSVALGTGATTVRGTVNMDPAAGDSYGVAIGNNASARIASSIAIGNGAVTENTMYGSNRPTSSIAIGLNAAAMGDQSIAIGRDTGSTNSNGFQNVAVGIASGQNIQPIQAAANNGVFVNASQNVAYGVSSGNNVTGTNNLALGSSAGNDVGPMTDATSGPGSPYCLFPPFYCYGGGASGGHNTAIGPASGNTVRGSQNIGIGFRSGSFTTGNNNMAIGQLSGFTVNGSGNVGVGSFSGAYLTGFLNTAVGNTAGQNVTGDRNSAYGNGAGINITGSMNTSLGQAAGQYTTGSNNVALGVTAGQRINGSNNIAIGNNANQSGNAANPVVVSYATAIGDSSRAWGTNTIALGSSTVAGVRNDTTVVDAIAIGNLSWATGNKSVAIGSDSRATGSQSISIGTGNRVTGDNSGAIGDPSYIDGDNSYGIGNNNTIAGNQSFALGNNNTVATDDTFVVGSNVTTNVANSVYLGANSAGEAAATATTAGMTSYASSTINGVTYNYAGATPVGVVTVGAPGAERRIQNVAAGQIAGTSTDAINGSQLYATNQAVEAISVTAGNTDERAVKYDWVDADGDGVVDPGEVNYTNVTMNPGGAATTIGNVAAGEVSATSTQAINGSQLHGTAQSIATNLGGGSVVNADGTVSAPAYVTSTGTYNNVGAALVAGNQQTNTLGGSIAAGLGGTSSYDPVTGSVITALNVGGTTYNDVNSALNALNTTASAGWNLQANGGAATNIAPDGSVNVVDGSNTRVTLTGNTLKVDVVDNPTFAGQVTMNGGFVVGANQTVDMGGNVIRNVGAGEVSATSTDAVNGSQLYQTNQAVQAVDNRVTNLSGDVTNLTNRVGANEINISAIQNGAAGMFQVNQPAGAAPAPTGTNAAAGGSDTVASGANSTAVGNQSVASGANSAAYGQGSQASGTGSTALGQGAVATGNSSIAIGSGSTAVADNVVSVGNIGAERRIVNVAPGVNGTDAVNVSQLQGYFAGGVQYDKNADGSVNHNSVTLNPGGTGPTVIHNVGAGVAPTDAVNVGQLNAGLTNTLNQANAYTDARFNDINNDIWTMRRDFRGATASAMAMAGLPQAYLPGKSMLAAGVGGYGGQYGIAVGLSGITENGKWVYKAQASGNTSDDWGFSAGVGIQW